MQAHDNMTSQAAAAADDDDDDNDDDDDGDGGGGDDRGGDVGTANACRCVQYVTCLHTNTQSAVVTMQLTYHNDSSSTHRNDKRRMTRFH